MIPPPQKKNQIEVFVTLGIRLQNNLIEVAVMASTFSKFY